MKYNISTCRRGRKELHLLVEREFLILNATIWQEKSIWIGWYLSVIQLSDTCDGGSELL